MRLAACLWIAACVLPAQEPVTVRVNLAQKRGQFRPAWAYFGHDEPNYTYMKYGKKLLADLAGLSAAPVYIRTHNLLTSGDGTPSLKWGSSNAYTEDAAGRPVYDWTILDRIFDTYRETGVKPLVEIGFMPQALSIKARPYRHEWPKTFATGWAYPPKSHQKWADLIYEWVRHCVQRYGSGEVQSWFWELWNEPNISYWQGTPEEYFKLYDVTAAAVKRALPAARIGGPHSTGPSSQKAAEFLRAFLEHCLNSRVPLDYIGFHAKGSPRVVENRVQMGIGKQLQDISRGFEIVTSFPALRGKPVIIGESDPEGCAACSARLYPHNAYRNGALYASYTAAAYHRTLELAERYRVNFQGAVTWAFEFEDQPYFDGFRTLATNGIAKPVFNVFRMLGMMNGERVAVNSSGAVELDAMMQQGVRSQPDINGMGTLWGGRELFAMVWNYHDDDVARPDSAVRLRVDGLPAATQRVRLREYRIDEEHSNAYTAWKKMGSPQNPSAEQYQRLQAAAQLELVTRGEMLSAENGSAEFSFRLPAQAVSLFALNW